MTISSRSNCLPLLLLGLAGCHVFSDGEITQTCEDIEEGCFGASSAPILSSVNPGYGHSSGGYTLTLIGEDFAEDSNVTFGGTPAQVLSRTPEAIEVEAPARNAGAIDVAVVAPNGETTALSNAFRYFADADGAQEFVAEIYSFKGYDTEDELVTVVSGTGQWVEPTDRLAWERYGATQEEFTDETFNGGCGDHTALGLVPEGSTQKDMVFQNGDTQIDFLHIENGYYELGDVTYDELPFGEYLDLADYTFAPRVTTSFTDFLHFPEEVSDARLSATDLTQTIYGDVEIRLENPTYDDDYKVIIQGFIYIDQNTTAAQVACVARDDGYFRVDADAWQVDGVWPENALMALYVGRMHTQKTTLPHTNGTAAVSVVQYQRILGIAGEREE